MFGVEFSHQGDGCTFETLCRVFKIQDAAVSRIAAIVHDLDLRDDRYQRPETPGVLALLDGIVSRFDDDHRRIAESAPLFDALYASLGATARPTTRPEDQ